jgi:hypothetical protein
MKKTVNPSKLTKNLQNLDSIKTQYYIPMKIDGVGFDLMDSKKFGDFGGFFKDIEPFPFI